MKHFTILLILLEVFLFSKEKPLEDLKADVEDIKFTLHGLQVDLNLLDGQWKQSQKEKLTLEELKRKIDILEKRQESIQDGLSKMNQFCQKVIEKNSDIEKKLGEQESFKSEMSKIKEMLTSLLSSLRQEKSLLKYQVKAGDSLEKISKHYHLSVEALKKANPKIVDGRILIGQEINIPQ